MTLAVHRHTPVPTAGLPFKVRPARRGDIDLIAALFAELGYAGAPDTSSIHWVISHPEMEVVVAVDGADKPIGVATLSHRPQLRMKGRIATVDELVVAQGWRRRGVGRALLKQVVARAKSLTARRIELLTHPTPASTPADEEGTAAFLNACGFAAAGARVFRLAEIDFQRR